MKKKLVEVLKWVFVLMGVLLLPCFAVFWIYAIRTMPASETVIIAELGGQTNRTVRTVSVPFESKETIYLQWAWDGPTNAVPEVRVVCDLVNESKDPVYYCIGNYQKIESGVSSNFFSGNLKDLIVERTQVGFQSGAKNRSKKLRLIMRFEEDFSPDPPVKVQMFICRPCL